MKRALRFRFALLSACVIAFAQIAVAAQPWPVEAAAHHHSAPAQPGDEATEHCAGLPGDAQSTPATQQAPSPNLCEVHCQDAAQPDALGVALASPVPSAWLPIRLSEPVPTVQSSDASYLANAASPPARVLFVRFLI